VQYATGVEHSTQHLKRHHFRTRFGGQSPWHGWFVEAGQFATDVGNWGRLQAGGAAALLLLTGRATLANVKAFALAAHAKGASLTALPFAVPLPPLGPLLKSAKLGFSGALSAAAAAGGAPVGGGAAAAAAVKGSFGGFGAFATSLQLPSLLAAPSAVVAAGLRRPLTGGAVAAAGASAGAMALGSAAGTDGGAAAAAGAGRHATLALTAAGAGGAGGGSARGALARVREQLGRRIGSAAYALQRAIGAAGPPGRWASGQPQLQRMAVVAAAEGESGTTAAAAGARGRGNGLLHGVAWLGSSAARLSGAIAAAARPRGAAAAAGGIAGGAALGDGAGAVDALLAGGGLGGAAVPSLGGLRKSASCGSLLDGHGDAGSIHYGGSGGRQTLRLPVPRLSWLRRNSNALVLRSAA
jgi:hypothetical protein